MKRVTISEIIPSTRVKRYKGLNGVGKSQRKSRQEKRLEAYVAAAPRIEIQTVIDPRIFRAIEKVAVQAIQQSGNDKTVRDALAALSLEIKMQSMARFGFYTADSEVLSNILRRTDPDRKVEQQTRAERDVFEHLKEILDMDAYASALLLRDVWDAFGRFLNIASRSGFEGGGARRTKVMQPLDVMSDDTWETYKDFFKPWITAASRRHTPRLRNGTILNSEVVHRILVEETFPAVCDQLLGLAPGAALKTLRYELKMVSSGGQPNEEGERSYVTADQAPAKQAVA